MMGREAAKVRKAERLLRQAKQALDEYFDLERFGPGARLDLAHVTDQLAIHIEVVANALREEGRESR